MECFLFMEKVAVRIKADKQPSATASTHTSSKIRGYLQQPRGERIRPDYRHTENFHCRKPSVGTCLTYYSAPFHEARQLLAKIT